MPQHGVRARHLPWSVESTGENPALDEDDADGAVGPEVTTVVLHYEPDPADDPYLEDSPYLDDLEDPLPLPWAGGPPGRPPVAEKPQRYLHEWRAWLSDRNRPAIAAAAVAVVVAIGLMVFVVAGTAPAHRSATRIAAGSGGGAAVQSTGPPAFTPIIIEAEALTNTLTGSATPAVYPGASGGRVVRFIGNWGSVSGTGGLRFNNIDVPVTGRYLMTFFYVNVNAHEPTRSVMITASGPASVTVTVAGGTVCCSAQQVWVNLAKGTNSITFANSHGHAPTIDRITIDVR
jgi:hypothetical protein